MTARVTRSAPAVIVAIGLVVVALSAIELRAAAAQSRAAERAHAQRIADADLIIQLRSREQTALDRRRPESDVLRLVTSALSEADLRTSPQIAPGGSTAVLGSKDSAQPGLMRQTVTVTLTDLNPPQIGAFLVAFESASGPWSIADIALTTNARPDTQEPRYTARLTLAAVYIADQPST